MQKIRDSEMSPVFSIYTKLCIVPIFIMTQSYYIYQFSVGYSEPFKWFAYDYSFRVYWPAVEIIISEAISILAFLVSVTGTSSVQIYELLVIILPH